MCLLLLRAKLVLGAIHGAPLCARAQGMLKGPSLLPVGCQGGSEGSIPVPRMAQTPRDEPVPIPAGCFAPLLSRQCCWSRGHAASVARAWPEACGSKHLPRSLRAPDGDAGVFPASFLLSAAALAFCTAGPKCVFHGVRAQRWTGRGCSWVLLGSLAFSPLLSWLGLELACGVASVQDSKRPCPSKQAVGQRQ